MAKKKNNTPPQKRNKTAGAAGEESERVRKESEYASCGIAFEPAQLIQGFRPKALDLSGRSCCASNSHTLAKGPGGQAVLGMRKALHAHSSEAPLQVQRASCFPSVELTIPRRCGGIFCKEDCSYLRRLNVDAEPDVDGEWSKVCRNCWNIDNEIGPFLFPLSHSLFSLQDFLAS